MHHEFNVCLNIFEIKNRVLFRKTYLFLSIESDFIRV